MVEITYTCSVCGQSFDSEETLRNHMVTNHSTKKETTQEGEEK